MPSGGSRPGAGRKPRAEKYERPINRAEKQIVDHLPGLVGNLLKRADGGYEIVEEFWEPAGTIQVDAHEFDDKGRIVKTKSPAFPHLPPEELVLVKRKRTIADNDVGANEYLVDRILGKPTAAVELSGPDGGPIETEEHALSDEARAERVARVLDLIRTRAAGPTAESEADLGTATGATD